MSGDGIPDLAAKLDHLFRTTVAPTKSGRYSNDTAAKALHDQGLEVSGVHLSHLRTGRRDNPAARLLAALSELFGVPYAYFFDPGVEDRIKGDLTALGALQSADAKQLLELTQGLSPESLHHLIVTAKHLRTLESAQPPSGSESLPS